MMRLFPLFMLLLLLACQNEQAVREIDMYNGSGDMLGTASFTEQKDGVKINFELGTLTPGFHGVSVHEFAKCEGPDFISAGNHFNPTGDKHGLMHPEGSHLGDLPNVVADANGLVEAELMLAEATLLKGKKSIIYPEGTSIIITSEADDGVTQPSGNSGERIACGVLEESSKGKEMESPTDPTDLEEKENE